MNAEQNIPEQHEGGQTNTTEKTSFDTVDAAKQFFRLACNRLKDVNKWEKVCGSEATHFALIGPEGKQVFRDAEEGDYFRINIPGPGNKAGDGYDWVRVEEIAFSQDGDEEVFFIRVRPSEPPVNNEAQVAHFFKDKATSTFMITRSGNTVSAGVHGRNEQPNTDAASITDKVRNALVGTASMLGFSLPQWKMLAKGLVQREENG